jgi:hypothetical protein
VQSLPRHQPKPSEVAVTLHPRLETGADADGDAAANRLFSNSLIASWRLERDEEKRKKREAQREKAKKERRRKKRHETGFVAFSHRRFR